MLIGKVLAANIPAPLAEVKNSFKAVLEQKRQTLGDKTLSHINNHHDEAARSIQSFMTESHLSPEKLLAVQYKTSLLLLREQMLCKTAELCSNTLKNFTQMQV